MKVVFDTNVWLSAVFWEGEASKLVKKAIEKKVEILISREIVSEIIDILNREEKFQKFISDRKESIEELVRTILNFSYFIETDTKLDVIKEHPKDNIILEAALDGRADYIVSYDKHILNMLEFRKIRILNPGEFLRILR